MLQADEGFWQTLSASEGPLRVIPQLERFYVRHESGLRLIRRLVELLPGVQRQVVVGCDSCAWAFLKQAVQLDAAFGDCLTLAPFDGVRLDRWLRLACSSLKQPLLQVGSEQPVCAEGPADGAKQPEQTSDMLRIYAAAARGNPGTAIALLRRGLRSAEVGEDQQSLWLRHHAAVELPSFTGSAGMLSKLVMHAPLLHNGLDREALFHALPLPTTAVLRVLGELRRCGAVEQANGAWRVAPAGYTAVRSSLANERFLVDDF